MTAQGEQSGMFAVFAFGCQCLPLMKTTPFPHPWENRPLSTLTCDSMSYRGKGMKARALWTIASGPRMMWTMARPIVPGVQGLWASDAV